MNPYLRISRLRQPRSNAASILMLATTFTLFALIAEGRGATAPAELTQQDTGPTLAGALMCRAEAETPAEWSRILQRIRF